MSENVFVNPDSQAEKWADIRMTDPEKDEWDVDVVIVNGQVEYVDVRVRPSLLGEFMECLLDDVDDERAATILENITPQQEPDPEVDTDEE